MTYALHALDHVDGLLDRHMSLQDIEAAVALLHLPGDEADALWLYAWAEQARRAGGHRPQPFYIVCPPSA